VARVRVDLDKNLVHCCTCGTDFNHEMRNPCPKCGVTAKEIEYRRGKHQGVTQFMVADRARFIANMLDEQMIALGYNWVRQVEPTYEGFSTEYVQRKKLEYFKEAGFTFEDERVFYKGEEVQ
jgi:predicted  nucleic acid-binding Zn-ribbon protein